MPALSDSVVIVTGAAQGIGERIAHTLADAGATLVLADIQTEKVASVAERLRRAGTVAEAVHVDVAEPALANALVATALDRFGRVDALVNNGALDALPGTAWEIDEAHWRRFIDVDLSGQWWCTKAVLPHMMDRRQGRIVFISSVVARVGSRLFSPAYAAAKAGLIGLTISLSTQLEEYGILVNAITPGSTGSTGTPMSDDEIREHMAQFPLGLGGPQPVADAVRYLLDTSGTWISGAVLNVSGGNIRGI